MCNEIHFQFQDHKGAFRKTKKDNETNKYFDKYYYKEKETMIMGLVPNVRNNHAIQWF